MISYGDKMECRIMDSDIQEPEDLIDNHVEHDRTDEWRQQATDDAKKRRDDFREFVREIFGPPQAD